jgi:hypothetical protein
LSQPKNIDEEAALFKELQREAEELDRASKEERECPVPKPRGIIGRLMGFEDSQGPVPTKKGAEHL